MKKVTSALLGICACGLIVGGIMMGIASSQGGNYKTMLRDCYKPVEDEKILAVGELTEAKPLYFDVAVGNIAFHNSEDANIKVKYVGDERFAFSYVEAENMFKVTGKKHSGWLTESFVENAAKLNGPTLDIYLPAIFSHETIINLDVGNINLDNYIVNSQTNIHVDVGDITSASSLLLKDNLNVSVDTGDIEFARVEVPETVTENITLTAKVDVGEITIFSTSDFKSISKVGVGDKDIIGNIDTEKFVIDTAVDVGDIVVKKI